MVDTILIVDDDSHYRVALRRLIERMGYQVLEAASCESTYTMLKKNDVDLIVLDYQLPDGDGLSVIEEVKKLDEGIEIILLTGEGTINLAVNAMKKGAFDFVEKGNEVEDLDLRIKNALEVKQLKAVSEFYARSQADISLVGNSEGIVSCKKKAENVAKTNMTVFLQGETGTGKELMARYIHSISSRRDKPFQAVNCAKHNVQFLNDELFGHEKGSYTDAIQVRKGKIELADSGTLFLDEIGDISLELQGDLLRFLQENTYSRCGSEKEKMFKGRVIVATNRNMEERVTLEKFRKDLYFRLNAYSIILPPLRERREDIPALIEYFLTDIRTAQAQQKLEVDEKALEFMMGYTWPGNVRELQHVLEAAAIDAAAETIQIKHLSIIQNRLNPAIISKPKIEVQVNLLDEAERKTVLEALEKFNWNQTHAAQFLKIDRIKLIRLMKKHGLSNPKSSTIYDQ